MTIARLAEFGSNERMDEDGAIPTNHVRQSVPLEYANSQVSAEEMQWVVRFLGWWLLLTYGIELAGAEIERATDAPSIFPVQFWSWQGNASLGIVALVGAGMIALRRIAFTALLVGLAVWPLVPQHFDLTQWLSDIPEVLPDAIVRFILIVLVYRRAQARELLRPPRLYKQLPPQTGDDLAWFTRIVGRYFACEFLQRCNRAILDAALNGSDMLSMGSSDLWLAGTVVAAGLAILGWRPALLMLAGLPLLQVSVVAISAQGQLPIAEIRKLLGALGAGFWGRFAANVGQTLVTTAMLGVLYWRSRTHCGPCKMRVPGITVSRRWIVATIAAILVYGAAVWTAAARYEIRRFITGEKPAIVHVLIDTVAEDHVEVSYSVANNTGHTLYVDLSHAELVVVTGDGQGEVTDPVANASVRSRGVIEVVPGDIAADVLTIPIGPGISPDRVELRGGSYRLGNGQPTTLPTGSVL